MHISPFRKAISDHKIAKASHDSFECPGSYLSHFSHRHTGAGFAGEKYRLGVCSDQKML